MRPQVYALFECDDEEMRGEVTDTEELEMDNKVEITSISAHALQKECKEEPCETIRFFGVITSQPVVMLIDSGTTHNFISPLVAKRLGCEGVDTKPTLIRVADDTCRRSNSKCMGVERNCKEPNFRVTRNCCLLSTVMFYWEFSG